jgi:hypothetical protein
MFAFGHCGRWPRSASVASHSARSMYAGSSTAKFVCTRCRRVTNRGRNVTDVSLYLHEHHLPNVYPGVVS